MKWRFPAKGLKKTRTGFVSTAVGELEKLQLSQLPSFPLIRVNFWTCSLSSGSWKSCEAHTLIHSANW